MRRFAFHFALFALAAAVSAALPAIARADRVSSAHFQARNPLGQLVETGSGDEAELAVLKEFARNPKAFVPDQLVARQAIDPSETIDKGKLAENLDKKTKEQPVRIFYTRKKLVLDDNIEFQWVKMPVGTYHTVEEQYEGSLNDAAKGL